MDWGVLLESGAGIFLVSAEDHYVSRGDPCFTVRHYFLPDQARDDRGMLSNCSTFSEQTNVEIVEMDLRNGVFFDRRTEFYFPDRIPLQFTRVVSSHDSRSRALGVGGTHSLNIFPVG